MDQTNLTQLDEEHVDWSFSEAGMYVLSQHFPS